MLVQLVLAALCAPISTLASANIPNLFARADGDQCKIQPVSPAPPSTTICGFKGTLSKPALLSTSRVGSLEQCVAACRAPRARPVCISFSYDSKTKQCKQYSKKITDQGWKRMPNSQSTTKFWTLKCWTCACGTGETECDGGLCYNLQSNANNCGRCGNVCPGGQQCIPDDTAGGKCACTGDTTACTAPDGSINCANLDNDNNNCGRCGNQCTPPATCGIDFGPDARCICPPGYDYCPVDGGPSQCLDTFSDPEHCGGSCRKCTGGKICSRGKCMCPTGRPNDCNGTCSNAACPT